MAPDTPAIRQLADAAVAHRVVTYPRARSVEEGAERQGITVDRLLKTLLFRRAEDDYVLVLAPGDLVVDWPKLRRHLGVNRVAMPDADEARLVTGYERGTITPLGLATPLPVVADTSIRPKGQVSIGAGAHGVSVLLDSGALLDHLGATEADVCRQAEPQG